VKTTLLALCGLALAALVAAAVTLYAGFYDISATDQHLAPTYWLLDTGLRESVKRRADEIAAPELNNSEKGFAIYRDHCVQCHGAPGVAPQPFALGLTPTPANLAYTASHWKPAELFWVTKEGIKMTGMPAWKYRLSDEEIWATVAFLKRLPLLSPVQYRELKAPPHEHPARPVSEKPDPDRGHQAINQYACITCHRIPGVVGPNAPVGPPLDGIAGRAMIAGRLPNTFDNMVRWLREPQAVDPLTAMPPLGVTERDARDIAAYLATLK
jgi:mono/diheme cytochrome c family protein